MSDIIELAMIPMRLLSTRGIGWPSLTLVSAKRLCINYFGAPTVVMEHPYCYCCKWYVLFYYYALFYLAIKCIAIYIYIFVILTILLFAQLLPFSKFWCSKTLGCTLSLGCGSWGKYFVYYILLSIFTHPFFVEFSRYRSLFIVNNSSIWAPEPPHMTRNSPLSSTNIICKFIFNWRDLRPHPNFNYFCPLFTLTNVLFSSQQIAHKSTIQRIYHGGREDNGDTYPVSLSVSCYLPSIVFCLVAQYLTR